MRTAAVRVIATSATVELAGRTGRHAADITPPPGRPFALGDLDVTLLPSGYIPGASHLLVECPGGRRTLYVSRLGPEPELAGVTCHTLVLAPGLPALAAAARSGNPERRLLSWIRDVLSQGRTPVLLVEIPAMLAVLGPVLHGAGLAAASTRAVALCMRRLASHGLAMPSAGRTLLLATLPRGGRPAIRLPRGARVAAVVDAAGADPKSLKGVDVVHGLAHAAGLEAYERLVVTSGARIVHLGPGTEGLPARVDPRAGHVRWIGPERQTDLGCQSPDGGD
jgi:hypothetical protein